MLGSFASLGHRYNFPSTLRHCFFGGGGDCSAAVAAAAAVAATSVDAPRPSSSTSTMGGAVVNFFVFIFQGEERRIDGGVYHIKR